MGLTQKQRKERAMCVARNTQSDQGHPANTEADANLALIAAAPDLLTACYAGMELARALAGVLSDAGFLLSDSRVRVLEAAIRSAEETP